MSTGGTESGPAVAVIIPARNAASTLEEAVTSALAQGPAVSEVIVVDDASSDGTGRLIDDLRAHDPRVRSVRTEAGSVAGARNAGAAVATAELLTFLDADDRLTPGSVMRRLQLLGRGAPAWDRATAGGIRAFGRHRSLTIPAVELTDGRRRRSREAHLLPFHICTVIVHRDAFTAVGGFSEEVGRITPSGGEDLLFVSDLVRLGVMFTATTDPVVEYRVHVASASAARRSELAVAAAFARTVAAARLHGSSPPEPGPFVTSFAPAVRARPATRAEVRLRAALVEALDGSPLRAVGHLAGAVRSSPAYVVWRLRQRGFAPHDPRWGRP